MTEARKRIAAHVAANPGEHFNELVRSLDLAPGQVQYHVRRLSGEDRVEAEQFYGQTHYYPPSVEPWERGALALARRETARDVLLYVVEHGPSAPGAVAADLDIARSTLEWHVDHLVEQSVLRKLRDDRNRVTLVLTRPEATVALLQHVTPTAPERLVDRFTRLVDGLFAAEDPTAE